MNILKELTKDFQYEENVVNPDLRKVTSGPFRGVTVDRNGVCYSRTGRTMKVSIAGFYKSPDGNAAIKPWRLCALVWHDQTPSLHLDENNIDKYLNLLSFIKLLEKYPDEYELVLDGTKTNYYPLSQLLSINVLTGCFVKNTNIKLRFPTTYSEIKWDYFNEICEKTISDFHSFKDKLKKELTENLGETNSDTNVESVENEPEEELEVCLSDPELGGAPSLKPKVKEDHSQSDICHSDNSIQKENNKMEENSNIEGYDPSKPMEAQDSSVLEEIELQGYRKPVHNVIKDHAEALDLVRGLGSDPHYKLHMQAYEERRKKDRESIDELQKLFDRRAQLKKMLTEIENEIEEKIKEKLQ